MPLTGIRNLVVSNEEADLLASLCDELVDGGEELLSDIAKDDTVLPVGQHGSINAEELMEGMDELLTVTANVKADIDRARHLRQMLRAMS